MNKKNHSLLILICGAVLFLFLSCGKNAVYNPVTQSFGAKDSSKRTSFKAESAKIAVADTANYSYEESLEMDSLDDAAFYSDNESGTQNSSFERKLIKNGNINLEVESLEGVEEALQKFAASFGGYITDSSSYETSYNATLRIPSNRIDEAMNAAGDFGKVKFRNLYSQDVTEEFYDLQTRLNTKKVMRSNLEKYLSQAKDIKDLLEIERQLNSVISDIEVMEGRIKRLTNQIDYSTLSVSMNLPTGFNESGFVWPDLGEDFKEFGVNFVNFLEKLFMAIFYITIFGVPLVALVAFLFWLLFGRIGLFIRLFKKISWKKNPSK